MAGTKAAEWLPRVIFESFLITMSILVALALDEWRENREDDEMVQQALSNFVSEMDQNKARLEDAALFNDGLLNVLKNRYEQDDIESPIEYLNMVESYVSSDLQTTAWDTAIATGSLAKMDYNTVAVLTLTYKKQNIYDVTARSGRTDMTNAQRLVVDQFRLSIYNSIRYLTEVRTMESELSDMYSQASVMVNTAIAQGAQTPYAPN
jgi:hypothetical protein